MALRDWHGWQIAMLWGFGIAIAWLVSRLGIAAVGGEENHRVAPGSALDSAIAATTGARAQVSGGGAPLWTTVVVLLIMTILLVITIRWVRANILDQ